jgi:hypothetical protein
MPYLQGCFADCYSGQSGSWLVEAIVEASAPRHLHPGICTEASAPRHLHQGICTKASAPRHLHPGICTQASAPRHLHQGICTKASAPRHLHQGICTQASAPRHLHQGWLAGWPIHHLLVGYCRLPQLHLYCLPQHASEALRPPPPTCCCCNHASTHTVKYTHQPPCCCCRPLQELQNRTAAMSLRTVGLLPPWVQQ